jgi:hypothetical protein
MARLFFMLLSLFTVPAAFASQYQYAGRFHDKEWYIRPYSGETPLGVLSFILPKIRQQRVEVMFYF